MLQFRGWRPCLHFTCLALALGGAQLCAQTAQTLRPGTDLLVHPFHPAVPPLQAATLAGLPARTRASQGIGPVGVQQIAALQADKAARSQAQNKVNSQCLYTARMLQNQPAAPGVATLDTGVELDSGNALVVELSADVTSGLLERLAGTGARVVESHPRYHSILALVPAAQVEAIAAWPDIHFIGPRQKAHTSIRLPGLRPALLSAVQPAVRLAAASVAATTLDSEGDLTHRARQARQDFAVDGSGLTIGVLSDGVTSLAASQALGALGPVTVLTVAGVDQTGSGDEGTAMLEIIHDLAPGASLCFATAFNGIASFADNIRALRAAGCDIIVDDVSYYAETRFQDGQAGAVISGSNGGIVAQAVKDVVASGAFYFSSAGNDGNLDSGTAGVYEGDFADGGAAAAPITEAGRVHQFAPGITYDSLTSQGEGVAMLSWADPLGAAADDYDLYLLDSTGTVVENASTDRQAGAPGEDPLEAVGIPSDTGQRLVVVQYSGSGRFFNLSSNRATLAYATAGATYGHNAGSAALTIAASPASLGYGLATATVATPNGPFPGAFTAANKVETFSSDGPRRIFFQDDGTPITPGNFSHTGGAVLAKPDFTAADGVTVTGVGGFSTPFYGTSAAAPHAAAITALVKSGALATANSALLATLAGTALDTMAAGWDRNSGSGILMPMPALAALGARTYANPVVLAAVAAENPGNGNGYLEIGEGGRVTVTLQNASPAPAATGISATLASTTAGVTIAQPATRAYPDLAPGASASGAAPFLFTVGPTVDPAATTVDFVLTVQASGLAGSQTALAFSVPLGLNESVTTTLGATPAAPYATTFATGIMNARLSRNGVAAACGSTEPYPGVIAGSYRYDAYHFTAIASACGPVTLSNASNNLFVSIYTPGFSPGNLAAGYLGDAGLSGTTERFQVDFTAGQTYTVVVNQTEAGVSVGTGYTLTLPASLLRIAPANSNHPPVALARDIALVASPSGTASGSVDNGSSDPDGDPVTLAQTPPGPYHLGATPVILTATDPKGAMGQATASVTVNAITTLTSAQAGTGSYGSTLLSAQVSAAAGIPTGTVAFYDGAIPLGSAAVSGGAAVLPAPGLDAGIHAIIASFSGTGGFGPSSSAPSAVLVGPEATTLAVSSPGPCPNGAAAVLTAQLACAYGAPAGTVTFFDGATQLGAAALSGSSAVYTATGLLPGSHTITARYTGSLDFAASTSPAFTQAVTIRLTIVPDAGQITLKAGQGGTLHLTVDSVGTLAGPVALGLTGLPSSLVASFSPATISAGGAPATVTVTLAPASTAVTALGPIRPGGGWSWLVLGSCLLAVPAARRRRRVGMLAVLAAFGLLGLTACGGSGSSANAPAGQHYTLQFTADSPSATQGSASVTLTVTP